MNKVLRAVDPEFPQKVADVIAKTDKNKLVVSMISARSMPTEWITSSVMHIIQVSVMDILTWKESARDVSES